MSPFQYQQDGYAFVRTICANTYGENNVGMHLVRPITSNPSPEVVCKLLDALTENPACNDQEAKMMQLLGPHPNILRFIAYKKAHQKPFGDFHSMDTMHGEAYDDPNLIKSFTSNLLSPPKNRLYMEYCDAGSLRKIINKYHAARKQPPEAFIWYVLDAILRALCHMQRGTGSEWKSILHRDFFADNILLTHSPYTGPSSYSFPLVQTLNSVSLPSPYPRIVLADFGEAVFCEGEAIGFCEPMETLESEEVATLVSRVIRPLGYGTAAFKNHHWPHSQVLYEMVTKWCEPSGTAVEMLKEVEMAFEKLVADGGVVFEPLL